MTDSPRRRARRQRGKLCIMHRTPPPSCTMHRTPPPLLAPLRVSAAVRRFPLLLTSLPHPHNFSSLAVAVLPPSHIFSPQPFPFERRARGPTGPEHPPAHTAPQEAAVAASAR